MKNHSLLVLFLVFLTGGCQEEDIVPANPTLQSVKTLSDAITGECQIDTLATGEIIQLCKPENWNGELIIFAHGYVTVYQPIALPQEAKFFTSVYLPQGYAFATTSYARNGLVVQTGIQHILDLRTRFIQEFGAPKYTYLTGASQGGLIAALAMERNPGLFSGVLTMSATLGDFQKRINHWGDFRALFDYFFPDVLPGSAVHIPDNIIRDWGTVYLPAVFQAIRQKPGVALKLLRVAQAPYDPTNPSTIERTILELLLRNVFFTRAERETLGGQPYYNWHRVYSGTGSLKGDLKLNARIDRFVADKKALENVTQYYQTSGNINVPQVNMYTTYDHGVLANQVSLYQAKVLAQGKSALYTGIPILRYGHYNFTPAEIQNALAILMQKVKEQNPPPVQ